MIAVLLAAASALVWGTADFCGGKAAQHGNALAVTVVSQIFSLPLLLAGLPLLPGDPHLTDLAWGLGGGVAGLAGVALLYRGLSTGSMVIVSPVTAVTAAVVPLAAGLALDGAIGGLALAGTVCAVAAIALISAVPDGRRGPVTASLLGLALTAGTGFGVFFILLGQVRPDAGMWPLLAVRTSGILVGLLLLTRSGAWWRLPRRARSWAAVAGPLDLAANALFLLAAMRGHLGVVAVLASLYPASTVLLALAVDRERVRLAQAVGLGLAAAALMLTAT